MDKKVALIILNTKINFNIEKYWHDPNIIIKICADGGANRLNKYNLKNKQNLKYKLVPDLIIGDMDSYTGFDTKIIKIDDQDTTDFTKCVMHIENNFEVDEIHVIGGFGGRFDHECSNMQTILKSSIKIIMFDKDNYVCKINIGHNIFSANGYCGLIPFTPSKLKTKGFTWDVDQEIAFGGLISTSNNAIGDVFIDLEYGLCLFWKAVTA